MGILSSEWKFSPHALAKASFLWCCLLASKAPELVCLLVSQENEKAETDEVPGHKWKLVMV